MPLAALVAAVIGFPGAAHAYDSGSGVTARSEPERATHWSFIPPTRPDLPPVADAGWPRNAIDRFILARLEAAGLQPAPEADRAALVRRLALDLTGLPPSLAEVDAFLADPAPDAYDKLADRLLASPRYGEHMARQWLDAARYADTHGYFTDHERFMWRWRDWVIAAFNRNLSFDRFTIDQLAGDLLPDATTDERIATGFHRNHMMNEETGIIDEEYRVEYVLDRVRTTASVWLGLTLGCAQCHDHKYDPMSQRDFYRFFAFFNNVPESGLSGGKRNAPPLLSLPSPQQTQRLAELDEDIRRVETSLADRVPGDGEAADDKKAAAKELADLRAEQKKLRDEIPSVMVLEELPVPRAASILVRGQYDHPGERVEPGVPHALPSLPDGTPPNRLGLARWLTDPSNPLTARVAVNRLWQQVFGRGIVATPEDFGVRGEPPSHPELLDWLATEFVQSGWDVKHMLRLIVTSATYRQSPRVTPQALAVDPQNRLLARSPRYRLDAEAMRDSALAVSGLLTEAIGGPSVKPYQPADLWKDVTYDKKNTQFYVQDHGANLYRRSMYTYWKRQVPPPSMLTLDAPTRELCTVRRQRTNTPLQALVLLNDPQFVEAARALAQRALRASGRDAASDSVAYAFRLATARRPSARETAELLAVYQAARDHYRGDSGRALELVGVGESPRDAAIDAAEHAAMTAVCEVVLNLDETITRE